MFRHRRLARSARALRLAWARPSAHLAPRIARTLQTQPGQHQWHSVWQEARSNLHARRAVLHDLDAALSGRLRHGRCACPPPPHLASRAHRGLWPLRRPSRTHLPRAPSFRRPPSSRRGEAAAALRGNLMAPERLLRGARAPNGLHRSHCNEFARRARRLASPCLAADRAAARPAQAKSGFATAHLTGEHVRIRDGLVAPE